MSKRNNLARKIEHGLKVIKADGWQHSFRIMSPGNKGRHITCRQIAQDRLASIVTDEKQAISTTCNQGPHLFFFKIRFIGRTRDEQCIALCTQPVLKCLQATGKNGVFHGRNNRADGIRSLGRHDPCAKIWRIAKSLHGVIYPCPGRLADLFW